MDKPKIAISIGDLNGIGFEIALTSHHQISLLCEPIYFISSIMAAKCANALGIELPNDFKCVEIDDIFEIEHGKLSASSGRASFLSFKSAVSNVTQKKTNAIVTMPISKEAWKLAGIKYVGHTDYLREHFGQSAIMVLGCEQMMVALLSDHIPLKDVSKQIDKNKIFDFLKLLKESSNLTKSIVLGLNPHAGDGGAIGNEEIAIKEAIDMANSYFGATVFDGPAVPDVVFNPVNRTKYNWFVAMYHDQGLAPLKALYFEESINVSLGLPIIRTSVDHGTAFDIAYKSASPSIVSYINAVKYAIKQIKGRNYE